MKDKLTRCLKLKNYGNFSAHVVIIKGSSNIDGIMYQCRCALCVLIMDEEPNFKRIISDFQHFLNIRGDNHKFMEHLFVERLKVSFIYFHFQRRDFINTFVKIRAIPKIQNWIWHLNFIYTANTYISIMTDIKAVSYIVISTTGVLVLT